MVCWSTIEKNRIVSEKMLRRSEKALKQNIEPKRALFVTTTASMIDQFNRGNIATLQKLGYEVHVACNLNAGNTTSDKSTRNFVKDMQDMGVMLRSSALQAPRR